METEATPPTTVSGWSTKRSVFKAYCWAMDGIFAFSLPLLAFDFLLMQLAISKFTRYFAISVATAVIHQIVFHLYERLQALTTKRARPVYKGNWWFNFLILDHVSNELISFIVVGGIQARAALWEIKSPILSLIMGMFLEPVTFFIWALCEDLTNKYVLGRESVIEACEHIQPPRSHRWVTALQWSLERLLIPEFRAYTIFSITIKTGSTYFTYWVGDVMVFQWAGVSSLSEATPNMRALIAFLKTVIYFETFLFIGMRLPDAVLSHTTPRIASNTQNGNGEAPIILSYV
jgi:hypothetical protein